MLGIRKSRVRPLQNSIALLRGSFNVSIGSPHCKASLLRAFIFTIFQGLLVWACSYFYATARFIFACIHIHNISTSPRLSVFLFLRYCKVHRCVYSYSQYFMVSSFERVPIFTLLQGFIVACIHILSDCNVSSRISCLNPIAKSSRYVYSYCQPISRSHCWVYTYFYFTAEAASLGVLIFHAVARSIR